MEFGQIPQLNEFQAQSMRNLEVVNKTNSTNPVDSKKEPTDVKSIEKTQLQKMQEDVKVEKGDFKSYKEVTLASVNFGYNNDSKDFFVKVKRGSVENQYPTDEMMRMKAYLLSANEKAAQTSSTTSTQTEAS